ncbi:putative lipid-transfer protein DIR1 [Nymphaea colorata]|nr:putative lipid-transfer protein DIR1 [Nymphaea colorata]
MAKASLLIMVVALGWLVASTAAFTICSMEAGEFYGCLPAIRGPSPSPPSSDCCNAIKRADLNCLCSYKDSALLPSFGVDPKLAMALPRKCNLVPPPACQGYAPASTPEPSS